MYHLWRIGLDWRSVREHLEDLDEPDIEHGYTIWSGPPGAVGLTVFVPTVYQRIDAALNAIDREDSDSAKGR